MSLQHWSCVRRGCFFTIAVRVHGEIGYSRQQCAAVYTLCLQKTTLDFYYSVTFVQMWTDFHKYFTNFEEIHSESFHLMLNVLLHYLAKIEC